MLTKAIAPSSSTILDRVMPPSSMNALSIATNLPLTSALPGRRRRGSLRSLWFGPPLEACRTRTGESVRELSDLFTYPLGPR